MSKYTTEVRFICETAAGLVESKGYSDIDNVLTTAAPIVFDFDFPMWDESYRLVLEKKILKHYYTREICAETVGLWKLWLSDRMNMIMPYYNKLYETTVLEYNPLYNVGYRSDGRSNDNGSNYGESTFDGTNGLNVTTNKNGSNYGERSGKEESSGDREDTGSAKNANVSNGSRTESGVDWNLYSDTPQGGIDGVDDVTTKYLTTAQKNTKNQTAGESGSNYVESDTQNKAEYSSDTEREDKSASVFSENGVERHDRLMNETRKNANIATNTNQYVDNVVGKIGSNSYASLVTEFRNTLINIDEMIIEELSDLFFNLW